MMNIQQERGNGVMVFVRCQQLNAINSSNKNESRMRY
jgi:hypothetical protein